MKSRVFWVVFMAACVALDAHTATRSYYNGDINNMWFAIIVGISCAVCFGVHLHQLIKEAKEDR